MALPLAVGAGLSAVLYRHYRTNQRNMGIKKSSYIANRQFNLKDAMQFYKHARAFAEAAGAANVHKYFRPGSRKPAAPRAHRPRKSQSWRRKTIRGPQGTPMDVDIVRDRWKNNPAKVKAKKGQEGLIPGKWSGKYRGPYYKAKYRKQIRYGVAKRFEKGGSMNDAECVYIGHAAAPDCVLEIVSKAVVKHMFQKTGSHIADINDYVDFAGCIIVTREGTLTPEATDKQHQIDFDPQTTSGVRTYADVALKLVNQTAGEGIFASGDDHFHQWHNIEIHRKVLNESATHYVLYKTRVDQLVLDVGLKSSMTLQNVSKSAVGGGTASEDVHHLGQNPIKGKVYKSGGEWLNGFRHKNRPTFNFATGAAPQDEWAAGGTQLSGSYSHGHITESFATLGSEWKKPPPGNRFGKGVTVGNIILQPGGIKKIEMKFHCRMTLASFIDKYKTNFGGALLNEDYFAFGFAQMVAFEKSLDSRQVTALNIQVDYELNQTYTCVCKSWLPKKTQCELEVLDTAI